MLASFALAAMIAATPQNQDVQHLETLVAESATAAYTLGVCERHFTDDQTTTVLAVLFLADEAAQPETTAFAGANARLYLKGRQDPRGLEMTSEVCQRLMYQSLRDMKAASEAITD